MGEKSPSVQLASAQSKRAIRCTFNPEIAHQQQLNRTGRQILIHQGHNSEPARPMSLSQGLIMQTDRVENLYFVDLNLYPTDDSLKNKR
jgi:hypothetical protein